MWVECETWCDGDRPLLTLNHTEAGHDPGALKHPVQQAALLDVITLLQFEVFCRDQLASEVARSLKPSHRRASP
jgi:hypothetical protein